MANIEYITPTRQFPPAYDWASQGYDPNYVFIFPYESTDSEYEYVEVAVIVNREWTPDFTNEIISEIQWGVAYADNKYYICAKNPYSETLRPSLQFATVTYDQSGNIISIYIPSFDTATALRFNEWQYIFNMGDKINIHLQTMNHLSLIRATKIKPLDIVPAQLRIYDPTHAFLKDTDPVVLMQDTVYFNGRTTEDVEEYGDTSGPDGAIGGTFDKTSDSVDFAALPTGGAAASGLITMFTPTSTQLHDFGTFLWTTLFDSGFDSLLTSLKKWVNDPVESVIQLSAYPVTPPAGSPTVVKFCGISSDLVGSGVTMNKCTSQFMDFDFGQLDTPAYWKQALDYTPYSKVSIYLPYIGICPLNADDVIDATLHLKYHIDLLTGGFSAELKCTKNINGTPLNSVLYNWSGNMATQIPITSGNFSQVFGSMMTAVAAIGVGAISGGLGASAAAAEGASTGAFAGALSGAGQGLAANIGNVINSKPHVTKSGRLDGTIGAMSQFTPYLIIERPVQSLSSKFQSEQGYPSNIVQTLSDLSGLTVCEAPILDGIPCTESERNMIRSYLTTGVIL